MKKRLNTLFALLFATALIFAFASCSDKDDDDDDVNIAGNTYVLASIKEVETQTDGSGLTMTMTMPSSKKFRLVAENVDKSGGETTIIKVDMTITKGTTYTTTFSTFTVNGESFKDDDEMRGYFLEGFGFDNIDDAMWANMTEAFSTTITLDKDGTWEGTIDGDSAAGTYKIDTGKSKIIVSTDDESETYEVGYSDGGKTLTRTETESDEDEGVTSVYTMTFTRQ